MRLLTAVVVLLGAYTSNVGAGFLEIEDLQVGEGIEVANGDQVTVHYTGWLIDGTKFDSSLDRGKPFTFELGARQVIQGWDRGVRGMQVGGIRGGLIPANSTLVFEVKLLEITR